MKIVVPYRDSPAGRTAQWRAVEEAKRSGATLYLVGHLDTQVTVSTTRRDFARRLDAPAEFEQKLEDVADGLRADGVRVITALPPTSTLSEAALKVATDEGADLIVIGIRRRSRVGKLVLGSDAQDILLGSPCEVLAVKAPDDQEW